MKNRTRNALIIVKKILVYASWTLVFPLIFCLGIYYQKWREGKHKDIISFDEPLQKTNDVSF